ncbi:RNA polymerase, sigma subunit, ECF family [Octadecabacter temperatus]|uniref:ECF RNA polymerase sigma factor SigW n=1 Tax=Octadecabacter temperatus TaxID=1458307 RepID=A0A0K0Y397_9RHOB|nr:sigma-70 family RNA polymerase sigma factor [Octadecabacter temperatus]AKS45429.1 ECF RNA polymerase sigma factor SigW [Octadecabacter temperatus]SIN92720.1 RNA polymerase, sigma subunit, ECF family [Octadecabacter temperatus]
MTKMAPVQSDADLLAAFAGGDRNAALTLTQRLTPRLMGQAYRMLGNRAEAEDVTQDAMMRLWKIAPEWDADRALVTTWLYRVVANLCTDRLRKSGRGVALDAIEEPADDAKSAADNMQDTARSTALHDALADLPERQAQAVALRHLEELGNPEIATIMDTNVRAVESLIARGKRALIAKLSGRKEELGYDDDNR